MKKLVVSLLAVGMLCSAFGLGGCKKKKAPEQAQTGVVQLAGFESLDELWYGLRRDFIGSAKLVDDSKYVSDGNKCLKLTMDGASNNSWFLRTYDIPYLPGLHMFEQSEYVADIEIKQATEFTIDVYNPTDRTIYITFVLDRTAEAYGWYETIYSVVAEIAPNGMTTAHFPINRSFMTDKWDLVNSYSLSIYDPELMEKGSELYFDNFCVKLTEEADAGLRKSFKKEELVNFATHSDVDYIAPYASTYLLNGYYTMTNNAPGGGSALRYTLVGFDGSNGLTITDYTSSEEKVGFRVSPKLLEIMDFSQFEKVSFDLYSRDRNLRRYYIELEDATGKKYIAYQDVQPNEWTTVSIDSFKGIEGLKITDMRIYTNAYNVFEQSDFYVKNIRYRRAK